MVQITSISFQLEVCLITFRFAKDMLVVSLEVGKNGYWLASVNMAHDNETSMTIRDKSLIMTSDSNDYRYKFKLQAFFPISERQTGLIM